MGSQKPLLDIADSGLDRLDARELVIDTKTPGEGDEVQAGDNISVHYVGILTDGTEFDSSYNRGEPLQFTVGVGMVIQGWDQGLLGSKVGEHRLLLIPYEMAYGEAAVGDVIPEKSDLVFYCEIVGIN